MITKCIVCQGESIQEVVENNLRYYYCKTCNKLYERALDTRYGKDITTTTQEGIWHTSVGALISKGNTFLMLKRRSFPFGFDFPAGHVEYGEKPEEAIEREVLEETGLKVTPTSLIYQGEMPGNKCKYGADNHIWFFYDCKMSKGTPFLNSENETFKWITFAQTDTLDLIPSAKLLLTHIKAGKKNES